MKKMLIAFAVLLLAAPFLHADTATVIEVVNVGKIRVEYNGLEEIVRLIGIVIPANNINPNDGAVWTQDKSLDNIRELVSPGTTITLEFDMEQRNLQNELLAYVYIPDNTMINNTVMLNDLIIYRGYADTAAEPPNVKYASEFLRSSRDAMGHQRGLWMDK
jgi:endonuclease YncB( thermonuclease family)